MKFKNFPKKTYIIIFSALIPLLLLTFFILITKLSVKSYPSKVETYEEFCLNGNFLLPTIYKINTSVPTKKEVKDKTILFNKYTLFAKKICFQPIGLFPESQEFNLSLSYFNSPSLGLFKRSIVLKTESYPIIESSLFQKEVNKNSILRYKLDDENPLIQYYLSVKEEIVDCEKDATFVVCDISHFNFNYGEEYEISLMAKYEEATLKTVARKTVKILYPVEITKSSISNNEVIKNSKIGEITLTLNKEILSVSDIKIEDSNENSINVTNEIRGKSILIYPQETFLQGQKYILYIKNLIGLDNSVLEKEYILNFSIDDGPSITGTNLKNGFLTSNNIVLTFDQDIDRSQNIKNFITVDTGTTYSFTIYKNRITINPSSTLSFCKGHTVKIKDGIKGSTGLISTKPYSYTFKTTCTRTYRIGKSVEGRSIYAYYLGTGSKKIIFYAAMHGSEYNTKYTLTNWIVELENNIKNIPNDKTIIILPTLNPDGVNKNTRFNANGVDLNRNFDTSTWASGTYFLDKYYETGGGSSPFSEPESRAIRDLILRELPYLTLSYHSAAGYVIPSNTSKAIDFAKIYSSKSGYKYIAPGTEGSFTYDITGSFGQWSQERGYNSLTVELSSFYSNQFIQNKSAMWEMVKR